MTVHPGLEAEFSPTLGPKGEVAHQGGPVASRDRPGVEAPGAEYRPEGAGGDESVERRAAGNGELVRRWRRRPPRRRLPVTPPRVSTGTGASGTATRRSADGSVKW